MYVWLYIYLDISFVVFIKVYIYLYHNSICTYNIFHCVFSPTDFPFYFSSAISMLQPQAEHHLTKGGLRGTHDESGLAGF